MRSTGGEEYPVVDFCGIALQIQSTKEPRQPPDQSVAHLLTKLLIDVLISSPKRQVVKYTRRLVQIAGILDRLSNPGCKTSDILNIWVCW